MQPRAGGEQIVLPRRRWTGGRPSTSSTRLFERNRLSLLASGLAGRTTPLVTRSRPHGFCGIVLAISVGQFHYETDGFRPNNDLKEDIYNVFAQFLSLSNNTSVQAEFRSEDVKNGDLPLRFDPENFNPDLRQDEKTRTRPSGLPPRVRAGLRADRDGRLPGRRVPDPKDVCPGLRPAHRSRRDGSESSSTRCQRGRLRLVTGAGYFDADRDRLVDRPRTSIPPLTSDDDRRHPPRQRLPLHAAQLARIQVTWTLGVSGDFFDSTTGRLLPRPGQPEGGRPVDPASRARRSAPPSSGRSSASWSPTRRSSRRRSPGSTSSTTTSTAPTPGATGSASTRSSGRARPSALSSPPAR